MRAKAKEELKKLVPTTKFNEPLKNHCTFRIGGPADAFIELNSIDETLLKSLLKLLKINKVPFIIIGGGTNILFHDKGFKGAVIRLTANKATLTKTTITAEAGISLQALIKKAKYLNLAPLTGIPGTLGGAIRGNAGANGLEIKDVLVSATILNPKTGRITTKTPKQLKLSYRNSSLKNTNEIVLKATLKLSKTAKQKDLPTRPAYGLSAGSFFKNPDPSPNKPKLKAGYLIDQCGLKGKRIGGAKISSVHANFIQNLNDPKHPATQKEVLALAVLAKKEVKRKFKIDLKEEVQIVPYIPTN